MNAFEAGEIVLHLTLAGGRIDDVAIVAQRPQPSVALVGREADAAVALVPLLYALCGKAQGRAATLALAAARGVETPPQVDAAVAAEAMREHLWRLLLDLPPTLGLPANRDLAQAALPAAQRGERNAVARAMTDGFWDALVGALARLPDVIRVETPLPTFDAAASLAAWPRLSPDLARWPTWRGDAAETGAHARLGGMDAGQGALAALWLARCAEVRAWADGIETRGDTVGCVSATNVAPGIGRAVVHTARGVLMHEIALDGDAIADYVVVAPTEWNFHPAGVLADWLIDAPAVDADAARALAAHAIAALDPCVATRIAVTAVPPRL